MDEHSSDCEEGIILTLPLSSKATEEAMLSEEDVINPARIFAFTQQRNLTKHGTLGDCSSAPQRIYHILYHGQRLCAETEEKGFCVLEDDVFDPTATVCCHKGQSRLYDSI